MTLLDRDCVTDAHGLRALAPEWRELWRRAPRTTPFQHSAWQLAWWDQFGTDRLAVGVLRREGVLCGLLPAYVLDGRLLPVGAGLSDSLDALVAPDAPDHAVEHLLKTVLAGAEVGCCDMIDLPPHSQLRHCDAPADWASALHMGAPCPVLRLAAHGDLRASVPASAHRKLRMNRNRADRAGGWSVELAGPDTLAGLMEVVLDLHAERWAAVGQPGGVLADTRVRATLTCAAPALFRDGALRVAVLRIGGDLAAGCVALLAGDDRMMLYLGGYAAAHASCSPGSLLLAALAEQAAAEGRCELHFLRGAEAYKYAWGAIDRHNATRTLWRA